jgi:dihydropyrimidine dehydrogenase (NAD+) subunit PreT
VAAHAVFEENPEVAKRFPDLHPAFTRQQAMVESNRCLNCFDAPCTAACPTHIDVPKFIKKIASGNLRGSATSILEANVLAASCSRVCPVEVLCEGSCVMHRYNEQPIAIGRLQRFAMETFYASGAPMPRRNTPERSERIACIGAGPASLACAAELRQQGFAVTIFDKRPLPGGLNTYGVAEYKLRTADSLREIELIRGLGVEFVTADIDEAALNKIESDYDAIFLGVGLGEMHTLSIPGGDDEAVVDALEYIAAYKTGTTLVSPPRVAVIGAGNTAIDAAVAARRLGATEVYILYRRDRAAISAFDFEYDHAHEEGVIFRWSTLPISLKPNADGSVALECIRTTATEQGSLANVPGSEFTLHCDLVIPAIGQSPLLDFLSKVRRVEVAKGRVVTQRTTGQTTNPKYFAGGDCINGGREVVDAVADGKRAAIGISASLIAAKEAVHG